MWDVFQVNRAVRRLERTQPIDPGMLLERIRALEGRSKVLPFSRERAAGCGHGSMMDY
jgi:hypothetical protein